MPTYYPLKIYQILTRLLTVSLSNMYSASADVGRLSFKDAAKIQQKFEIHKLFCIFLYFATHRTFGALR